MDADLFRVDEQSCDADFSSMAAGDVRHGGPEIRIRVRSIELGEGPTDTVVRTIGNPRSLIGDRRGNRLGLSGAFHIVRRNRQAGVDEDSVGQRR